MTKIEYYMYLAERKRRGHTGSTAISQSYAPQGGRRMGLCPAFIRQNK